MFDKSDLKAAEDAGILSREQVKRFTAFLETRSDPGAPTDTESLRFIANFNDIFITIGIVILGIGLTILSTFIVTPIAKTLLLSNDAQWVVVLVLLPVAGVMWILAEYFSRRRRLLLPSMALITLFTLYVAASTSALASAIEGISLTAKGTNFSSMFFRMGLFGFVGGFGAAALAFWRFRLPFTFMLMALFAACTAYSLTSFSMRTGGIGFLIVGLATLTIAIWFDAKDPQRVTRNSDHAFWLHLAAAPQIIWGIRNLLGGTRFDIPNSMSAFLILLTLCGIAALALALNRRALIAAGLLTMALALQEIVSDFGGGLGNTTMVTLILLGAAIILLGGGWHTARGFVLQFLPTTTLTQKIFPPETLHT